jgi:hypothetical protein
MTGCLSCPSHLSPATPVARHAMPLPVMPSPVTPLARHAMPLPVMPSPVTPLARHAMPLPVTSLACHALARHAHVRHALARHTCRSSCPRPSCPRPSCPCPSFRRRPESIGGLVYRDGCRLSCMRTHYGRHPARHIHSVSGTDRVGGVKGSANLGSRVFLLPGSLWMMSRSARLDCRVKLGNDRRVATNLRLNVCKSAKS